MPKPKVKQDWQIEMDAARDKARIDLIDTITAMSPEERKAAQAVAQWWKDNYLTAGHKRLAYVLMAIVPEEAS